MDFNALKQRLSLQHISQSLLRVLMRFPVAVTCLSVLTILSTVLIIMEKDPDKYLLCTFAFLCVGTFISLAASLWGEEQADKRKRWIAEGVSLALCAVYYVLLFLTDIIPNRNLPAFWLGNAAWVAAVAILIPFGSFLKEKDDLKSWHFMLSLCAAFIISGMVTWVMIGGLEGLVFGTAALFDFKPDEKLCVVIMVVCEILLWGLLFFALVPQGERKHNHSVETPSFLTKVVSWLLLPLLGCYILVLYAYGFNILLHWELPKGMISWLVSAVMGGYLLCYILLYPQVADKHPRLEKLLTLWLPVAVLPLLILMTVGVVRRFMDYGVTPPRLYLLTLLLWFYAVCIVMLAVPRKRFRWIFLSLAALFLLSSGHPFNYYRICRPVLTAKIDKMIAGHGLQAPFKMQYLDQTGVLPEEEADELRKELDYMRNNYGEDFTARWIEKFDPLSETDTRKREETSRIRYYKPYSEYLCPQGYSRFEWVSRNTEYLPDDLTKDDMHDGVLHVNWQDAVLLFDTAFVSQAAKNNVELLIPSLDGQAACSPSSITITSYSDHTYDVQFSGYVFTKE